MATGDPTDPSTQGGTANDGDPSGSWFQQNAPPVTADQVAQLYQQYLGRAPENDQVVQAYINGIGKTSGLAGIQAAIQSAPEAKAYAQRQATNPTPAPSAPGPSSSGGGAPTGGSLSDPAYARSLVDYYAKQPGADPSLANDPNYWVQKMTSGEFGADQGYAVNKMQTAWQQPAGGGGGGGGGGTGVYNPINAPPILQPPSSVLAGTVQAPPNVQAQNVNAPANVANTPQVQAPQINAPTATTFQAPQAPQYSNYTPGAAPTPTPYTMPTAAEAAATPGYQFALQQGQQAISNTAAAQGGMGGGLLKDISAYTVGMADQNYNNLVQQGMAANQQNNTQALNQYNATTGAGLGAGNLNLQGQNSQFQNTYNPQWNAYLSNIGQQQYGTSLDVNQAQYNAGLANNTNQYNAGLQLNQGQFGANLALNQAQWNAGADINQNQFGMNAAINQNQFNANAAINQNQFGANFMNQQGQFNANYLNNQNQFGANFGLASQGQFWNQGLAQNQNAYNQWANTDQMNFNQAYAKSQQGYVPPPT